MEYTLFENNTPGAWIRLRFFTESDMVIFESVRTPTEDEIKTIVSEIKETKASRMVYHLPSLMDDVYIKIREMLGEQIEYGAYVLNSTLHEAFHETIFHRLVLEQDPVKSFYSAVNSIYPRSNESIELTEEEVEELELFQKDGIQTEEDSY